MSYDYAYNLHFIFICAIFLIISTYYWGSLTFRTGAFPSLLVIVSFRSTQSSDNTFNTFLLRSIYTCKWISETGPKITPLQLSLAGGPTLTLQATLNLFFWPGNFLKCSLIPVQPLPFASTLLSQATSTNLSTFRFMRHESDLRQLF